MPMQLFISYKAHIIPVQKRQPIVLISAPVFTVHNTRICAHMHTHTHTHTYTHTHTHTHKTLQSEKPGPSANEVIARAIAKGILDGEGITVQKHIKKPKGTTKKSRRVFSRYDGIPMTIAAKQKVVGKKQFHDSHRKPFV